MTGVWVSGVCGTWGSQRWGPAQVSYFFLLLLTFAVRQVGKTVSQADNGIKTTPWRPGYIFVEGHPVGLIDDWVQQGEEKSGWHRCPSPPPSVVLLHFTLRHMNPI